MSLTELQGQKKTEIKVPLSRQELWLLNISRFLEKYGFALAIYNEESFKQVYSVIALSEVKKANIARNHRDHTYHIAHFNDENRQVRNSSFGEIVDGVVLEPRGGKLPRSILEANEDSVVLTACLGVMTMLKEVSLKPDDSWIGKEISEAIVISPSTFLKETFSILTADHRITSNGS